MLSPSLLCNYPETEKKKQDQLWWVSWCGVYLLRKRDIGGRPLSPSSPLGRKLPTAFSFKRSSTPAKSAARLSGIVSIWLSSPGIVLSRTEYSLVERTVTVGETFSCSSPTNGRTPSSSLTAQHIRKKFFFSFKPPQKSHLAGYTLQQTHRLPQALLRLQIPFEANPVADITPGLSSFLRDSSTADLVIACHTPLFATHRYLNLVLTVTSLCRRPSSSSLQLCHRRLQDYSVTVLSSSSSVSHVTMDSLTTHPSTAQQAKAFTSPASLSFPGGAGDLTPPSSEKEGILANGSQNGSVNGQQPGGNAAGNGVTPATPAATPGANNPGSGIVPTLQ